jgi:general secretion pathway protein H
MITTHGHTPDRSLKTDSGFTLIELLVVIVIIGIILSVATLSMGVLGRDNDIEDQAKRLKAVIEQVKEESELQGRDVGLLIEKDGYLFMRYDYATQHWQFMNNDDMTDYRQLPAGLQMRLWLEDREIIVNTHQENQELLSRSSSSSSSSQSSTTDIGYQSNTASNTSSSTMKDDVMPQIMILSSGDISPFELRISRDQSDFSWRLIGSDDSTLTLDSGSNLQ